MNQIHTDLLQRSIKNTNHQDFVYIIKYWMKQTTYFNPIVHTNKKRMKIISEMLVKKLKSLTEMIYNRFNTHPKSMSLTEEKKRILNKQQFAIFVKNHLKTKIKKLDYCHFTGKYRGAAHNKCNLQCLKPLILQIIFHSLQGYDSHVFIEQLAKVDGEFNCIPSTEEKYISFSKKIKVDE